MSKLHELLAAEKTRETQVSQLLQTTETKFGKGDEYFTGRLKTLRMLTDDPANPTVEAQAREEKALITNVPITMDYVLNFWANYEDMQLQKHTTEQNAKADIELNGEVLFSDVPIDEILGLDKRLTALRAILAKAPTLNSSRKWVKGELEHTWELETPDVTSKIVNEIKGIVLAPATDKHPAQVEKTTEVRVVGQFTTQLTSGAVTAQQKADVLALIDELIAEVRKARSRCNEIEVNTQPRIGNKLKELILGALLKNADVPNDR